LWIPAETEKVEKNSRETAGICGVARLLHSRRQLIRSKLNRALRQIIHEQAGVQGGQHYQYRPDGKNRWKVAMLKKSLQEIQHPGSDPICFHRFRSRPPLQRKNKLAKLKDTAQSINLVVGAVTIIQTRPTCRFQI
jgi:hypothetical protein